MKDIRNIGFEFVDAVPTVREEGKLYISIKFRTAIHNCFCGCGNKVVTPIRPSGWRLTYNGDEVSLHPSVGNWSFKCQSHYWIENNKAIPAGPMQQQDIEAGRRNDKRAKEAYFSSLRERSTHVTESSSPPPKRRGFLAWLFNRR